MEPTSLRRGGALAACGLLASLAQAQVDWTLVPAPGSPVGRTDHTIAYDAARERVVMFAGAASSMTPEDVSEWDGQQWRSFLPPVRPGPQLNPVMSWDPAGGGIVLLAWGSSTWRWDGARWAQLAPATMPGTRYAAAMATDPLRRRIVLFGGADASGSTLADTWEWDGQAWQRMAPPVSPRARLGHGMAYDESSGEVVMVAGVGGPPYTSLSDMWSWNGSRWLQILTASAIPAVGRLVYDSARARLVWVTGGTTWEWIGGAWTQRITNTVTGLGFGAAAYDVARQQVVSFGGQRGTSFPAETWIYESTYKASASPFGAGCSGSAGTPILAPVAAAANLPWLGGQLELELSPLPLLAPAALLVGVSRTAWQGSSLPFSLGPIGMPGCALLVSDEALLWMSGSSGRATLVLPVPAITSLVGGEFHVQSLVLDPTANSTGAIMSNGVTSRIGAR